MVTLRKAVQWSGFKKDWEEIKLERVGRNFFKKFFLSFINEWKKMRQ